MSWRHAVSVKNASAPAPTKSLRLNLSFNLFLNFGHLFGVELLEERLGLLDVELRIGRFDTQEKSVDGCVLAKALYVEHGMIGHRQLVEGKHSDDCAERG